MVTAAPAKLVVEQWPIGRLVHYARNPRVNDPQIPRMIAAIREFGFRIPIVARSDGLVIDGHLRLKAAAEMGLETVPVALADNLTETQIKAFRLLANQSANWADWDNDLLSLELTELREFGFDLEILGFRPEQLQAALQPITAGLTDPDEAPEPPAIPTSQPGDVWILGPHRVLCGDSTGAGDVARLMAGEQADCLWTDPPYNVAYKGAAGSISNDDMSPEDFAAFLAAALDRGLSAMRPGAAAYVAHADTEGLAFRRAFTEAGFKLSSCLVWRKNSLVLGRSDYQWQHEPILYGWKPGAAHSWFGGRDKTTVFDVARPSRSVEHPTMKPVELVECMLANSTRLDGIVLDLFGGSGSTLIACERLGRKARLVEVDPRFVDVIVKRWEGFTGLKAALEGSGQGFDEIARLRDSKGA